MKPRLIFCLAFLALASCKPVSLADYLEQFLWRNRIAVVLTPDATHPDYIRQQRLIDAGRHVLSEQNIVLFKVEYLTSVRENGALKPAIPARRFYDHFGVDRGRFQLILIGTDGEEVRRSDSPIPPEQWFAAP